MSDRQHILLTGASGFLAAWIIPRLLARGHGVHATDLTGDRRRLNLVDPGGARERLDWSVCDIGDGRAVAALAAKVKPTAILHLAALQIPGCRESPALGVRVNIEGHVHMLEAARAHKARLVYTSSIAAKPRGPANAPANLYGVYKKSCEEIARIFAGDFGVGSIGLRPHVVYGVGRDQGETSAITAAMQAAAERRPYHLPWRTRTCFQFAGDIADMFVRAVEVATASAVIADMSAMVESTDDVRTAIDHAVPGAAFVVDGPERLSPTDGFDIAPLAALIGPLPQTSLADGVAATIAAFERLHRAARPAE